MKRILVGTDGSLIAQHAADIAADIARSTGAQLVLVHVLPLWEIPSDVGWQAEWEPPPWPAWREHGLRVLAAERKRLEAYGIDIDTNLLDGDPARVLLEEAQQRHADLVVVGSQGHGALARMLLGSVSNKLAHTSDRPILIVPPAQLAQA